MLMIIYESLHGVVFWFFSKEKPEFGFRIWYAYAAAPEWFFPKSQYILSYLCPIFVITIVGILLTMIVPLILIVPLIVIVASNIAGSIGDMYIFWRVFLIRKKFILINDCGKGFAAFLGP